MTGDRRAPSVRWLTLTAWTSLIVYAATSTIVSTSLTRIGSDLGLSLARRGALAPARSIMLALAAFTVGYIADRVGKRRLLRGAVFFASFVLLCLGTVQTYAGMLAATLALGVGLGGLEALVSPLVAELHPDDVELHMPLLHAFYPFGIVVSSLAVGLALDRGVPWRSLFGFTSIPMAMVAAMFLFGRYGKREDAGPRPAPLHVSTVLHNPTFWLLAVSMMLTAGVEGTLVLWTPSFVQHEYGGSAFMAASGLTGFSAAMAVGRLATGLAAHRVRLHRLMAGLALAGALVTGSLVAVHHLGANFAAFALSGLLVACFWPGILSMATRRIAAGSATLLAMLSVGGIAGYGSIPWLVGFLADRVGLRLALAVLPTALTAAALALLMAARLHDRPTLADG
mgnify:FL=1